jgi:hypothetical protein
MRRISSLSQKSRNHFWTTPDNGLLAIGAILLICAPILPGPSRLVVLPALLLAPGHAFLRLLGLVDGWRSVSISVPASIVLIALSALILDGSGIKLDPVSLGSILSAITALCLVGSYGRQLLTGSTTGVHRRTQ